jgi:hypothetical protein
VITASGLLEIPRAFGRGGIYREDTEHLERAIRERRVSYDADRGIARLELLRPYTHDGTLVDHVTVRPVTAATMTAARIMAQSNVQTATIRVLERASGLGDAINGMRMRDLYAALSLLSGMGLPEEEMQDAE